MTILSKSFLASFVLTLALPMPLFAQCTPTGYTVIFVNGILTSEDEAQNARHELEFHLPSSIKNESITTKLGYNPSHFQGVGDLLQSVTQAFGKPISSYDLNTILLQLYPEITTRKILLVGHSQGSFYVNELYDYFVTHGVPSGSIGVYVIATPASYVAGGGAYVTSKNDKVINLIRDTEIQGNNKINANSYYVIGSAVASALRANIDIPKESGWENEKYGGHQFSLYLDGAGERIIHDVEAELRNLRASEANNADAGCFVPPKETLAYQAQKAVFSIGDEVARNTSPIVDGVLAGVSDAYGVLASGIGFVQSALSDQSATHNISNASQASAAALAVTEPATEGISGSPVVSEVTASPVATPSPQLNTEIEPPPQVPQSPTNVAPVNQPTSNGVTMQPGIPQQELYPVTPGYGGGGGGGTTDQNGGSSSSVANTQQQETAEEEQDTLPDQPPASPPSPTLPSIQITEPANGAVTALSDMTMTGTATADSMVFASGNGASIFATTTRANESGTWSFRFTLLEGTTTLSVSASNQAGVSATSTIEIALDTVPPAAPVASIGSCAASLVAGSCVVPGGEVTLVWSEIPDASYYRIVHDGALLAPMVSTISSRVAIDGNATTTFAVVAYDRAGNAATSTAVEVAAIARPLIINEIGWGGIGSTAYRNGIDHDNQWIELENLTEYPIDLSHISIERIFGASIHLSGTIPKLISSTRQNFIVIARSSVPNAFGNTTFITPFDKLSSSGDQLKLVWNDGYGTTTLDATPAAGICASWCAGAFEATIGSNVSGQPDLIAPLSMERVSQDADGEVAANWKNTDSYGTYIQGGSGAEWGTPGTTNSQGLPDEGVFCGDTSHMVAANEPFDPGTAGCTYLSKFITGYLYGAKRYGGLYRGDIGSSTEVMRELLDKKIAGYSKVKTPAGAISGEHFFFAIYEDRSTYGKYDSGPFVNFFTKSASTTLDYKVPHGNYAIFRFIYQP